MTSDFAAMIAMFRRCSIAVRFQTVFPEHVREGAPRNLVAQIGQGALDSSVAPILVLRGHAHDRLLSLLAHTGTPRATLSAALMFPGDELAVPSQAALRRGAGGQFTKHAPAQLLGLDG